MKRTYDGRKERVFKEGKRGKGAEEKSSADGAALWRQR